VLLPFALNAAPAAFLFILYITAVSGTAFCAGSTTRRERLTCGLLGDLSTITTLRAALACHFAFLYACGHDLGSGLAFMHSCHGRICTAAHSTAFLFSLAYLCVLPFIFLEAIHYGDTRARTVCQRATAAFLARKRRACAEHGSATGWPRGGGRTRMLLRLSQKATALPPYLAHLRAYSRLRASRRAYTAVSTRARWRDWRLRDVRPRMATLFPLHLCQLAAACGHTTGTAGHPAVCGSMFSAGIGGRVAFGLFSTSSAWLPGVGLSVLSLLASFTQFASLTAFCAILRIIGWGARRARAFSTAIRTCLARAFLPVYTGGSGHPLRTCNNIKTTCTAQDGQRRRRGKNERRAASAGLRVSDLCGRGGRLRADVHGGTVACAVARVPSVLRHRVSSGFGDRRHLDVGFNGSP